MCMVSELMADFAGFFVQKRRRNFSFRSRQGTQQIERLIQIAGRKGFNFDIEGVDTYDLPIFLYCYVTRKSEDLLVDKFSRTVRWERGSADEVCEGTYTREKDITCLALFEKEPLTLKKRAETLRATVAMLIVWLHTCTLAALSGV